MKGETMSHAATHWAWQQRGLTQGARLVLLRLADAANDDNECWPAHNKVAEQTGMTRRHVKRCVDQLVELALIQRVPQARTNGSSAANQYHLNVTLGGHSVPLPGDIVSPPKYEGQGHGQDQVQELPLDLPKKPEGQAARSESQTYTAASVVSYFVDRNNEEGISFASSVKAQVAKTGRLLVADGISREVIEQAIDEMISRGLHPSVLPSLVSSVQAPGYRRRQTKAQFLALNQRLEREEDARAAQA